MYSNDSNDNPNTTASSQQPLTYAEAIPLLVQKLQLNIRNLRFIKAPQASDYFITIPNDAPYSEDMLVAHLNGLSLDADLNPSTIMKRAAFANLLAQAIPQIESKRHESGLHVDTYKNTNKQSVDTTPPLFDLLWAPDDSSIADHSGIAERSEQQLFQQILNHHYATTGSDETQQVNADDPLPYADALSMIEYAQSLASDISNKA